ncbi:MAG TPA: type II toxin-antitoxin system PemK/MazF family toxin [Thermoanaerobaculia bacterium]|nr:type II toxin-antitoxin system PemK/MazF family toxin [Thermoanaerobaculia bacterium]
MKSPQRGQVWLVDLGMAAKVRPCLVLSIPLTDVDRALVTVIPHTTRVRGSRFEIQVATPFLRRNGVFDTQNLLSTPLAKLVRYLGGLTRFQMVEIEKRLCFWLGLPNPGERPEVA